LFHDDNTLLRTPASRAYPSLAVEPGVWRCFLVEPDHGVQVRDRGGWAHGAQRRNSTEFGLDSLLGAHAGARRVVRGRAATRRADRRRHDAAVAFDVCERFRAKVIADGDVSGVTISCGVAQLRSDELATELLLRADAALYQAEALGRDRVVIAAS
jgi:hypothetical protein